MLKQYVTYTGWYLAFYVDSVISQYFIYNDLKPMAFLVSSI